MFRFEKIGQNAIQVDLHNDYSVMAIAKWIKTEEKYVVKFYIGRNDIESFDLVTEMENIKFNSNIKQIPYDMAGYITEQLKKGNFDKAIERYEYQQRCFERGNDMFESERISNAS